MTAISYSDLDKRFNRWSINRRIRKARTDIFEEMAEALSDGEPILEFLEKKRDRNLARKKPIGQAFALWARRMQEAGQFSRAIEGTVPTSDLMVINSAEQSGLLAKGLAFLVKVIEALGQMKKAIIGGIAIPSFIFLLLAVFIVLFSVFGIPVFASVLPPEKWHPIGKIVFGVSVFVTRFGVFIAAALAGLVWWLVWSMPNWVGPWRDRFDGFLPYSLYRDYQGAVFIVVLASLIKSNVAIGEALKIIAESATPWIKRHVAKMISRMNRGLEPAEALNTGILHEDVAYRIIDYGERTGFQEALEKMGFRSIEILTNKVTASAKILFVVALIMAGTVISFFFAGIYLTAMEIDTVLKGSFF